MTRPFRCYRILSLNKHQRNFWFNLIWTTIILIEKKSLKIPMETNHQQISDQFLQKIRWNPWKKCFRIQAAHWIRHRRWPTAMKYDRHSTIIPSSVWKEKNSINIDYSPRKCFDQHYHDLVFFCHDSLFQIIRWLRKKKKSPVSNLDFRHQWATVSDIIDQCWICSLCFPHQRIDWLIERWFSRIELFLCLS